MASRPTTAAAGDRREELEGAIWRSLQERPRLPLDEWERAHVETVMKAADAYAKAARPRAPRKPKPPGLPKPPAVHYAPEGSAHPACRPFELLRLSGWAVAADPQAVTCGHCRKTPAWLEAS